MANRPGGQKPPPHLEREFLELVLAQAHQQVKSYMLINDVSLTLALALTSEIETNFLRAEARGMLILPYYWAEYEHNGRGPVEAPLGKVMIFFPNKRDDPRTRYGFSYPQKRGTRRSLTKAELNAFSAENRRRKKAGQDPILIFTKHVSNKNQQPPGKQFYVNALRLFRAPPPLKVRFDQIVKRIAPDGTRKMTIRLG